MNRSEIIFCGDTFLRTREGGSPLERFSPLFHGRTVCLNLETALAGGRHKDKNVALCVDLDALDWLTAEVHIVTLVNNHVADGGDPQYLAAELSARGKVVVGPTNPAITTATIEDIRVDIAAAYFSLPRFSCSYNRNRVRALHGLLRASSAHRKIVNLHWGYEHTDVPAPFQRQLAYDLIDSGADLIIGHHPHVPQGWEIYRGKPIFYSLGNFNFWQLDGSGTDKHRCGYVVTYDLVGGQTETIPYRIDENYRPYLLCAEETSNLNARLEHLNILLSQSNQRNWFATCYAHWYRHEMKVWKRRCGEKRQFTLWLKWLAWWSLPLQWKYRLFTLLGTLPFLGRRQ